MIEFVIEVIFYSLLDAFLVRLFIDKFLENKIIFIIALFLFNFVVGEILNFLIFI